MSEPTAPRGDDQASTESESEDALRQHPEGAAEGTPETGTSGTDVPREHSEDPAEG